MTHPPLFLPLLMTVVPAVAYIAAWGFALFRDSDVDDPPVLDWIGRAWVRRFGDSDRSDTCCCCAFMLMFWVLPLYALAYIGYTLSRLFV